MELKIDGLLKSLIQWLYAAFFTTVFQVVEKLCAVFKLIFAAQVALIKIQRNEA